jgi:predicted RNA-binding protein with PIN domain
MTNQASRRWLIDGMNLIGSRPDRWWNDPDRAVRRLIDELNRYASASGDEVTVVFDRRPPDLEPGKHGAVGVVFASRHGRNAADDEIVKMLAARAERAERAEDERAQGEDPGPPRVVTSDRRLVERVREQGAAVTSTSSFRRRLEGAPGH